MLDRGERRRRRRRSLIGYWRGDTWSVPGCSSHRPLNGRQPTGGRTQALIQRFGGPAALLGRFVAVVRAGRCPAVMGISESRFRTFALFAVIGGIIWATAYTMLG